MVTFIPQFIPCKTHLWLLFEGLVVSAVWSAALVVLEVAGVVDGGHLVGAGLEDDPRLLLTVPAAVVYARAHEHGGVDPLLAHGHRAGLLRVCAVVLPLKRLQVLRVQGQVHREGLQHLDSVVNGSHVILPIVATQAAPIKQTAFTNLYPL